MPWRWLTGCRRGAPSRCTRVRPPARRAGRPAAAHRPRPGWPAAGMSRDPRRWLTVRRTGGLVVRRAPMVAAWDWSVVVPQSRSQTSRSFVSTDFFNRPSLDRSGLLGLLGSRPLDRVPVPEPLGQITPRRGPTRTSVRLGERNSRRSRSGREVSAPHGRQPLTRSVSTCDRSRVRSGFPWSCKR